MNTPARITYYRHKVLLALLQAFGGQLTSIDLQKYLFLFTREYQGEKKSYEFVPFRYGCFSFQCSADRRKLVELGVISANPDRWELTGGTDYRAMLAKQDNDDLDELTQRYRGISGNNLLRSVYTRYPYYAIRSEVAETLLSQAELKRVDAERPGQHRHRFFTIGYEGKSFEHYLNQLIRNNIRALCDVRRNPLSRKYGFSKTVMRQTLHDLGIEYFHLPELGIVSEKRQSLNSRDDYRKLFDEYEATTLKQGGDALRELATIAKQHGRVAITCFEAESCMCHRGRVASALKNLPDWDIPIEHL